MSPRLTTLLHHTASRDLRNMVKSIAQLPRSYKQGIEVTLNDRNLDIVARNAIMLLVAVIIEDVEEAAEYILHIWYSALIRKSHIDILQESVQPLIKGVCKRIKAKAQDSILGKT